MKNLIVVIAISLAAFEGGYSQNVNWRSLGEEQHNIVQLNTGYDFGATAQLGYSRSLSLDMPVIVELDYSFPMGREPFDDFKVRLGGQVELLETGGFSATVKILSVFRRYQTELVRIASFGSDFGLVAGYYNDSWYAAGEFGFDKAITSNLKHTDIMRSFYPEIRDGWYVPTGGHYYYGIQAGKSIGETLDLTLRTGATTAQASDENAALPYYLQLGLGMKF